MKRGAIGECHLKSLNALNNTFDIFHRMDTDLEGFLRHEIVARKRNVVG